MAITKQGREQAMKKIGRGPRDTGSPEVQIALLTDRINDLTKHFKLHVKDQHSRFGLIQMVGKRKRQLEYLRTRSPETYQRVITQLGLRK